MRNVIQQSILLPASAEQLFAMYLDPGEHAALTGSPVMIAASVGAEFRAFEGMLSGRILALVPSRLIVQSWRSAVFHDDDPDSTLILAFTPEGDQASVELVHLDVPDHDYQDVMDGWPKHYWTPWRRYLDRDAP